MVALFYFFGVLVDVMGDGRPGMGPDLPCECEERPAKTGRGHSHSLIFKMNIRCWRTADTPVQTSTSSIV